MNGSPWWRGAVIYQIYPRSFLDTNGDGIGDLPGIVRQLDYVRDLGVDAIWISPFFKSPQRDYGYDVEDYCDVDPMFGALADADRLIEAAHSRRLKVLVDLVLSHTSNRHPWFRESRQDRTNPKANWYVWADASPDGTPPNNWLSVFGGVSWQWDPVRRQYYLHNFFKEQPDLNVHCPDVVAALMDVARFWLERGVDGFRLDAIDCAVHDPELRSNPVRPPDARIPGGLADGAPFGRQIQLHNKGLKDVAPLLLEPLRQVADGYGDILLLGEITGDRAFENVIAYGAAGRGIHMAYTFDLLSAAYRPDAIGDVIDELEVGIADGWPCWSFSNHDIVRAPTRLGGDNPPDTLRRQLPVLLTCLRGSICLYQGCELGLEEADVPFEQLHDPYGIEFWPTFRGRDGCRTPMPWQADAAEAGFTTGTPWLPMADTHRVRAVDVQVGDPASVLASTRRFLTWRREQPALRLGAWSRLEAPAPLFAFERRLDGTSVVCAFNLSDTPATWAIDFELNAPTAPVPQPAVVEGRLVTFQPHGVLVADRR